MGAFFMHGSVAEWTKATVLKTDEPKGSVGSNPTASAINFSEKGGLYGKREIS